MESKTLTIEEVIEKINKALAENEEPPVEPPDNRRYHQMYAIYRSRRSR